MHKTSKVKVSKISGVYECHEPAHSLPIIFDSPHSGTKYPDDFDYACDFNDLERAEDKYVEELFDAAPEHGASFLHALFPRSYLDLNRAADDVDNELLSCAWPDDYTPINPSNRSHAGIGLIRRLVKPGVPVYAEKLSPNDIQTRIEKYYKPYHQALENLIETAHYNFGQSWHINCHSMPSPASKSNFTTINPFQSPDFVLGDRNGTSCDLAFTHALRDFLKAKGYKVAVNNPYKGVELVERYSAPATGRHSIQIEICRSLYMNEKTCKKSKNFNRLKDDIIDLIHFIAAYAQANLTTLAAD